MVKALIVNLNSFFKQMLRWMSEKPRLFSIVSTVLFDTTSHRLGLMRLSSWSIRISASTFLEWSLGLLHKVDYVHLTSLATRALLHESLFKVRACNYYGSQHCRHYVPINVGFVHYPCKSFVQVVLWCRQYLYAIAVSVWRATEPKCFVITYTWIQNVNTNTDYCHCGL